jgi:phosphoglycolate phosphatase
MSMPIDTVLFDFDGTLVETPLDFARMRREVLALAADYGAVPLAESYILEIIAHAQQQLGAHDHQTAEDFVQRAERILTDIEMEGADHAQPLPGVEETLRKLRERGISIAIVTRNCRPAVERVLERFPLPHDLILTRDDVVRVKPDPDHLLEAVRQLGSQPERVLMVGDHPMDVLAGYQAGMRTAATTFTHPVSDFDERRPDLMIDCLPELLNHVKVMGDA